MVPFQVYELQATIVELEVTLLWMVRFRVAVESHPCALPPAKKAV